jgi:hypothetical protein
MCGREDNIRMRHLLDAAKEAISFARGKTVDIPSLIVEFEKILIEKQEFGSP